MSLVVTRSSEPAVVLAPPVMSSRTRRLLEAPILPTLLQLAAPNIALMLVQAMMSAIDALYVGRLGPGALAGVALAFPLMTLLTARSGGGAGRGISWAH